MRFLKQLGIAFIALILGVGTALTVLWGAEWLFMVELPLWMFSIGGFLGTMCWMPWMLDRQDRVR